MFEQETIAAIATSSKNGSISVIRVSGDNSFFLYPNFFRNLPLAKIIFPL